MHEAQLKKIEIQCVTERNNTSGKNILFCVQSTCNKSEKKNIVVSSQRVEVSWTNFIYGI